VLWAFSGGIVVNPVFYPDVRYDPLKDLIPVDLIGTFQVILVVPRAVPANSIKELLVLAKASGANEYTYASGGIGSPNHLAGEMLKRAAGVNLRHVPYKGGGPAVVSVLSGETKMYFAGIGSVREHMKSGALKALAVTGPKRASEAPSVPTMQEAGIAGYDVQAWIGALVPAGTSKSSSLGCMAACRRWWRCRRSMSGCAVKGWSRPGSVRTNSVYASSASSQCGTS